MKYDNEIHMSWIVILAYCWCFSWESSEKLLAIDCKAQSSEKLLEIECKDIESEDKQTNEADNWDSNEFVTKINSNSFVIEGDEIM